MTETTLARPLGPAAEWVGAIVESPDAIPPTIYCLLVANYCWITIATIEERRAHNHRLDLPGWYINPPYPPGQPPLVW
jgi:hypothetical protein